MVKVGGGKLIGVNRLSVNRKTCPPGTGDPGDGGPGRDSIYRPTMSPARLMSLAEVTIAPGKSIVVKVASVAGVFALTTSTELNATKHTANCRRISSPFPLLSNASLHVMLLPESAPDSNRTLG